MFFARHHSKNISSENVSEHGLPIILHLTILEWNFKKLQTREHKNPNPPVSITEDCDCSSLTFCEGYYAYSIRILLFVTYREQHFKEHKLLLVFATI